MDDGVARVEKTMSLDLSEFHRSLRFLAPDAELAPETRRVRLTDAAGAVEIAFEALPTATLGGLLSLPRARVTLTFDGHASDQRQAFLARFDQAFQRGGG